MRDVYGIVSAFRDQSLTHRSFSATSTSSVDITSIIGFFVVASTFRCQSLFRPLAPFFVVAILHSFAVTGPPEATMRPSIKRSNSRWPQSRSPAFALCPCHRFARDIP